MHVLRISPIYGRCGGGLRPERGDIVHGKYIIDDARCGWLARQYVATATN
jgi:hypothetical protein